MQLFLDERIALLVILIKRLIENRCDEIAPEVKEATPLYTAGKFQSSTAEKVISKLHSNSGIDE